MIRRTPFDARSLRRGGRALMAALLAAALGCGEDAGPAGGSGLAGSVVVDGSSTVFRISNAAQKGFHKAEPKVKVALAGKGTGGGFGRYLRGELDIVDASRAAKPEEESQAKAKGLGWTRFLVGYDGITVVVNPKNDFVKALTVEQLKRLFELGSKVTTWKDLDPSWPDRKIVLLAPDHDSGTFEFFAEAIVGRKQQRDDLQASADDNTLVTGVAGDPDGLGYFGYAYYAANRARLRAVPIQGGPDARPVAPDRESILGGQYTPLARPLYIYVKDEAMKRPEVAAFVRYYLDNIDDLATKAGYVPPTADDRAANQAALAGPAAGRP